MVTRIRQVERDGSRLLTVERNDGTYLLPVPISALLALPLAEAKALVDGATEPVDLLGTTVLPPVDTQEVWAAGVTYRRSRDGRIEESQDASIYDRVYDSPRPEVFFKASAARVVADGEAVGIRADSGWDVPEAELGLVITSGGELFGYVVGNDMSSRSIEGDNALYLPQAKVYERSCALGSAIVPVWDAPEAPFAISLVIVRDGDRVFSGETSTESIVRTFPELIDWLTAALPFPDGAILLTGTGVVPERDFTLQSGDVVEIEIAGIGTLTNPVVTVGRRVDPGAYAR